MIIFLKEVFMEQYNQDWFDLQFQKNRKYILIMSSYCTTTKPQPNTKTVTSKTKITNGLPFIKRNSLRFSEDCPTKQNAFLTQFTSIKSSFSQKESPENVKIADLRVTLPKKVSLAMTSRKMNKLNDVKMYQLEQSQTKTNKFRISKEKSKQKNQEAKTILNDLISTRSKEIQRQIQNTVDQEYKDIWECGQTLKLTKILSSRDKSSGDRMNSCKVAMKRVFPLNKKSDQMKISQLFQRQDTLSTIQKKQLQQEERFISFDSFTHLVF